MNMEKQATKMLNRSQKKLKEVSPGDCVAVFTSEFDRGKGDPANIIGLVLEVNENKKYKIGTKAGIIQTWLERNCFESINYKGLEKENIPEIELSIREIIKILSVGSGQGFQRCSCKTECNNKRCKCFKNNMKCNSSCHSNKSCANH